ncbi:glycoside hydrolase family 61 protein [Hypoxylon sp. CI-4A]|nr:glycoside hydrolase family 61 protein [Hypoxylon sp. CI-4A]
MKTQSVILGLVALAKGHTIFQKVSVDGVDQGQLKGLRAPDSDYPIQNVNDAAFACNKDLKHLDSTVITVPAGSKVGAWWGHVIGGAQTTNDPDNPIAPSHKGPISVYLAKFKVAEEGLSNRKWAVDNMIANNGWHYFTMPQCVAPGDYLMRVELIALHGAQMQGQAQFYMECAQIRITGSGTKTGSDLVSFPGAYKASDPGILVSIYDNTGSPYMGGKQYQIPGPSVLTC